MSEIAPTYPTGRASGRHWASDGRGQLASAHQKLLLRNTSAVALGLRGSFFDGPPGRYPISANVRSRGARRFIRYQSLTGDRRRRADAAGWERAIGQTVKESFGDATHRCTGIRGKDASGFRDTSGRKSTIQTWRLNGSLARNTNFFTRCRTGNNPKRLLRGTLCHLSRTARNNHF